MVFIIPFTTCRQEIEKMCNTRKIAVIGCGAVGATIAYTLATSGNVNEIVLIDINRRLTDGLAFDISHGLVNRTNTYVHSGNYDDIRNAGIAIICAGVAQQEGESRLDLLRTNAEVMINIAWELKRVAFGGIVVCTTNPVDICTDVIRAKLEIDSNRVIGTGTILDSARLRFEIAHKFNISANAVSAIVIGEHGDSQVALPQTCTIGGVPISSFCSDSEFANLFKTFDQITENVRAGAAKIISGTGATCYGIAMAIRQITDAIISDVSTVLPLSVPLDGEYGIRGVSLSIPCLINGKGIVRKLCLSLTADERAALLKSAAIIQKAKDSIDELINPYSISERIG